MRQRRFTPGLRRRLAEIDDKPGLGDEQIQSQAAASVRRLTVIDEQPEAWRALLNDFPELCRCLTFRG